MDKLNKDADRPERLLELDNRFPSGPWTGFFLQPPLTGRFWMELRLTFSHGRLQGDGRDRIGVFTFAGTYDVRDGTCHWTKRYVGQHAVAYRGYNEGKGIWGVWDIPPRMRGGFHIWPVGISDPTAQAAEEHVEEPLVVTRELVVPTAPTRR
jgi:hypothetical protein